MSEKTVQLGQLRVEKTDEDKRLVFGWASIFTKSGDPFVDLQGHTISVADGEAAFYGFCKDYGVGNANHTAPQVSQLVECMVFTKAKQDLLGIELHDANGEPFEGAWCGFYVDSDEVWKAIKDGDMGAFSIEGTAVLVDD